MASKTSVDHDLDKEFSKLSVKPKITRRKNVDHGNGKDIATRTPQKPSQPVASLIKAKAEKQEKNKKEVQEVQEIQR